MLFTCYLDPYSGERIGFGQIFHFDYCVVEFGAFHFIFCTCSHFIGVQVKKLLIVACRLYFYAFFSFDFYYQGETSAPGVYGRVGCCFCFTDANGR